MKVNFLFLLYFLTLSCSANDVDYLCFSDPEITLEKICYPSTESSKKDLVAMDAIESLIENFASPGSLVKLSEEMLENYTPEKFSKSLNKHYRGLNKNDVMHTLTHGDNTAILLKTNATLIYSHKNMAFFFSYDPPIELAGATNYFGSGFKPKKVQLSPKKSICNIEKEGVLFISPPKQQMFYSQSQSFCEYKGRFFKKANGKISVARIDQIGQGYSTLHGNFYKFLLWLKNKS